MIVQDQMICCILMLSSLVSSVWGTFKVNVTQRSYQAEENGDVTLEWTFTTTAHNSSEFLFIYCSQLTVHKELVLFYLHEGVEVPESQDEQFSGRVQWDTDVLREGRLRLHVSRLRTEDSGSYVCKVSTGNDGNIDICRLSVTAAVDEHKPQRPTVRRQLESQGWTSLHIGLIPALAAPGFIVLLIVCALFCKARFVPCLRHLRNVPESESLPPSESPPAVHRDLVSLTFSASTLTDSSSSRNAADCICPVSPNLLTV